MFIIPLGTCTRPSQILIISFYIYCFSDKKFRDYLQLLKWQITNHSAAQVNSIFFTPNSRFLNHKVLGRFPTAKKKKSKANTEIQDPTFHASVNDLISFIFKIFCNSSTVCYLRIFLEEVPHELSHGLIITYPLSVKIIFRVSISGNHQNVT